MRKRQCSSSRCDCLSEDFVPLTHHEDTYIVCQCGWSIVSKKTGRLLKTRHSKLTNKYRVYVCEPFKGNSEWLELPFASPDADEYGGACGQDEIAVSAGSDDEEAILCTPVSRASALPPTDTYTTTATRTTETRSHHITRSTYLIACIIIILACSWILAATNSTSGARSSCVSSFDANAVFNKMNVQIQYFTQHASAILHDAGWATGYAMGYAMQISERIISTALSSVASACASLASLSPAVSV